MVIYTYSLDRKYLVENIKTKFPKYSEKQFKTISFDRLEYLSQLVIDSEPNAETEIKRILKIK